MIVTPIRTTSKPATAVKETRQGAMTFADLLMQQTGGKANDNPATAVTRKVPNGMHMHGQFFDVLA